jgi:hypothetical protein
MHDGVQKRRRCTELRPSGKVVQGGLSATSKSDIVLVDTHDEVLGDFDLAACHSQSGRVAQPPHLHWLLTATAWIG